MHLCSYLTIEVDVDGVWICLNYPSLLDFDD